MKKEKTRILSLVILGLFLVSILSSFVIAKTGSEYIKDLLAGSISEDVQGIIAKILLMALVALLVYSIAGAIPFVPDNDTIRWAISIVIAVLSFLFISVDNIKYILVNYEALGVALTTFIPLVIILIFTFEFREKKPELAGIINKLIILLFALYTGFQWFNIEFSGTAPPAMFWAYPVTLVLTLFWLFIEKLVAKWSRKAKFEGEKEKAEGRVHRAVAGAKELEAVHKGMAGKQLEFNFMKEK